ncbi:dcsG [Symbiodinium sp. CCMP2456]|nr:dcsG [Symbiodinium sp. CCMP2456]
MCSSGRLGFLSMDSTEGWCIYDDMLVEPFKARGWAVTPRIPWRRFREHDWSQYDIVVVRSTWDYQDDLTLFHAALDHIASKCAVENSVALMKWNSSKLYLKEMANHGCPILPTAFVVPGDVPSVAVGRALETFEEVVIKPAVGASSFDTFRIKRGELEAPYIFVEDPTVVELRGRETQLVTKEFATQSAFIDELFSDVPCLVQPFVSEIMSEGEYSLFYFCGALSHAMHKLPKAGDYRSQEDYGAVHHRVDIDSLPTGVCECASRAIQALPLDQPPLYSRMDVVVLPNSIMEPLAREGSSTHFTVAEGNSEPTGYALMEAELIEPSLYFNIASEGIANFIEEFCKRHGG